LAVAPDKKLFVDKYATAENVPVILLYFQIIGGELVNHWNGL